MTPTERSPQGKSSLSDAILSDALTSARGILNMEVGFIARFETGHRVFIHVDALDDTTCPIRSGDSDPLAESYCQRVVDGRLPEVITDATRHPEALTLPATLAIPIGAHLSVPIRFSDGRLYGTFCCFSRQADHTLDARSLATMHCFADFIARTLESLSADEATADETRKRIQAMLDSGDFTTHYQPIIHIGQDRPVGQEALTRFLTEPYCSPDQWFDAASRTDLHVSLELEAMKRALAGLAEFPEEVCISLNVSPDTILKADLDTLFTGQPLQRLVLEITEHSSIGDYSMVASTLRSLRDRGLRLAIDDAGAGYASFQHILRLKPDIIKLDRALLHRIESDRGSRALVSALVNFARETGSIIVAEGVETRQELAMLEALDIQYVQGYFTGRPQPIEPG